MTQVCPGDPVQNTTHLTVTIAFNTVSFILAMAAKSHVTTQIYSVHCIVVILCIEDEEY